MRSLYKRPWFLRRTLHRPHPHDYRKRELVEALNLEWSLLEWKIYHRKFSFPCFKNTAVRCSNVQCSVGTFRIVCVDIIRK